MTSRRPMARTAVPTTCGTSRASGELRRDRSQGSSEDPTVADQRYRLQERAEQENREHDTQVAQHRFQVRQGC